jgi:hypothetical protein
MPYGTDAPNRWPGNKGNYSQVGTKFVAIEGRGDDRAINQYLINHEDTFTISVLGVIDARTFTATAGHTIATGDYVELTDGDKFFQAYVTNVATNVITVDSPLPFAFTVAGTTGVNGSHNANKDGSSTEFVLEIAPPSGAIWDIAKINIYIQDATAMDSALFGGITALTEGVYVRVKRSATEYEQLANYKSNLDFTKNSRETEYLANMVTGKYGLLSEVSFGGEQEHGTFIRLDGSLGQKLEVVASENLTTLEELSAFVQGYVLKK